MLYVTTETEILCKYCVRISNYINLLIVGCDVITERRDILIVL